jgi:hypothetical protein
MAMLRPRESVPAMPGFHREITGVSGPKPDRNRRELAKSRGVKLVDCAAIASPSIQSLDDPDQLVSSIAVLAREERELARLSDDGPMFGARRDRDAAPSAELEQSLVAQLPERAQDGVPVDLEDGRQVAGRWQALARLRLPFGDRPPDLGKSAAESCGNLQPNGCRK